MSKGTDSTEFSFAYACPLDAGNPLNEGASLFVPERTQREILNNRPAGNYRRNRRRTAPARPSAPVPSSISDDGSGTGDMEELEPVSRIAPLFAVAIQSGAEADPVFRKASM